LLGTLEGSAEGASLGVLEGYGIVGALDGTWLGSVLGMAVGDLLGSLEGFILSTSSPETMNS
jgi:phage tail tape-measure protein